jgi:hypothetical protein
MQNFWSIVVDDPQTRSMLQMDNPFRSVSNQTGTVVPNEDGSVDVWFSPDSPSERLETNWIKTAPGKGWFALFRFYGPLQPYFDKTWILPNVEKA